MRIYERIRLGTSNSYLIEGQGGLVLVDCGNKNCAEKFHQRLLDLDLSPDQVKLIVVTHVHLDHVGSLSETKKLCGCKVAVHKDEANLLRTGTSTIPPGTNPLTRAISWLGRNLCPASQDSTGWSRIS
jgi:hydroxyacylglutathione hydrolase